MGLEPVTLEQAISAVEACVAERGADYRYPDHFESKVAQECNDNGACLYWWGKDELLVGEEGDTYLPEGPGCIVGLALSKLGWEPAKLQQMNFHGTLATCAKMGEVTSAHMTDEALRFLNDVQGFQDDKHPWGQAVADGLAMRWK